MSGVKRAKGANPVDAYVFISLALFSFSMLLFSTRSFIVDFRNTGLSVYSGVRGSIHGASTTVSRSVLAIRELTKLQAEYNELKERLTRFEQMERTAVEIREENLRLREQLGFSEELRYKHIAAEISGRDPDNLYTIYVINKGKTEGIKAGMPVVAFQNGVEALVGKVLQVGQLESLVMPVFDTGCFVASRFSQNRFEGIVEGSGSPDRPLVMRLIAKRARDEISVGDLIVSSGMGGVYPAGINLGRISSIHEKENQTSIEAEIESAIDFSRLEYVFAIDAAAAEAAVAEAEASARGGTVMGGGR
jgi:rod shape-determining protein MreC